MRWGWKNYNRANGKNVDKFRQKFTVNRICKKKMKKKKKIKKKKEKQVERKAATSWNCVAIFALSNL